MPKIVSMSRKYHNHKPQTNPWHREEEPHNHHETAGRQTKQSNLVHLTQLQVIWQNVLSFGRVLVIDASSELKYSNEVTLPGYKRSVLRISDKISVIYY